MGVMWAICVGRTEAQADQAGAATSVPRRVHVQLYPDRALTEPARLDIEASVAAGAREAGAEQVTRAVRGAIDVEAAAQALTRNDLAAKEARRRTSELDLDGALNVLDWAAEEYATYLPELVARDGKPARLVEIYVLQAIAHYLNGDEGAATEALQRALVLDPSLSFDPALFPPQLEELVERQTRIARAAGRGRLRVEATPGSPVVFVNGVERGTAPLLVRRLPVGPNLVHVRLPGAEPVTRWARISGRPGRLSVALEARSSAIEGPLAGTRADVGEDSATQALHDAARALDVEALLLVLARPAAKDAVELTAYVYDMRSGALVGRSDATVPTGNGNAAQELGEAAIRGATWRPLVATSFAAESPPMWKRPYFWAAVGAVAGAVVVGSVIAANSGLSPGEKLVLLPAIQF